MTSERRTIDPTLLNTLALLAIVAGAVVTAYGIGYGVVKYYQYKPLSIYEFPLAKEQIRKEQLRNARPSVPLIVIDTHEGELENQRRAKLRQQATEKAIYIGVVGGLILFTGVVLIAVARRAPSRFT
jgi:hypothetical protein